MAVIRNRDECSLTTRGGGFRTIPLLERSGPSLGIDLACDVTAAQVQDDVLIDTPPGSSAVMADTAQSGPITAAMAKADAWVCVGSDRGYPFPHRLEDARETYTQKGRCKVGWIVSRGGRESWDVWLEVSIGLVKLIRQVNA